MVDVQENSLPQAGILNKEENPAIDSDRVKSVMVDKGSTYFGEGGGAEARYGHSGWCRKGGSLGPYCISKDERRRRRMQPGKRGTSEIICVVAVGQIQNNKLE